MTLHFVAIFIIYDFVKTAKKEDYCLGGIGMTVDGDFGPGKQRIKHTLGIVAVRGPKVIIHS